MPHLFQRASLLFAAAAFTAALASPVLAQSCAGTKLDHALSDPLMATDSNHQTAPLKGLSASGAMAGVEVLDCNGPFFIVRYNGAIYAIPQSQVVKADQAMKTKPCRAGDEHKAAGNGLGDGGLCG